jgi:Flp pilus assembly protein TadD
MNMSMVPAKNSSSGYFRTTGLACAVIVLAALAVYANSFSGPFVLDDPLAITDNPTIKHLGRALSPPIDSTTGGRPVVNLSFAINYALGGMNVWGYHAFNLLVHMLAGLTLFGLVRRTLVRPVLSEHFGTAALPLALAVAVVWIVHPLQTEAVTYISQRAESLMGLFYLLTLYCFVRSTCETGERREATGGERSQASVVRRQEKQSGVRPPASSLWSLASISACLLGAMSKEIIVTAPVMVFLYDRTFVAGSFREAWRQHWRYYLGLACMWLLLARMMTGLDQRGIGFDPTVTWWSYGLTSCRSIALYCKLACWPHPLVFDYGTNMIRQATEAVPYVMILAALLTGTGIALLRWPVVGFAGLWFLAIFAPTTSVIPVYPVGEHRIYLSLASVIALAVLGLHRLIGRRGLVVCAAAAAGLGWLSVQRNKDYRSSLALWSDTVAKCPDNARARIHLGNALLEAGQEQAAIAQYDAALQSAQEANFAETYNNLGIALDRVGQTSEAIQQFAKAVRMAPDDASFRDDLGIVLGKSGRMPEAIAQFEEAVRLKPDDAEAYYNLGTSLGQSGRMPEAISALEEAVRLNPDYAEAHNNLGLALYEAGRKPEAIDQFKEVLRIRPDSPDVRALVEKLQNAAQ